MDITSLQSDRILIAAFVSVLVGFITAVLSIVRLVNDKEGKTTDYRQSWTDSLRKCLSELISNLNTLAGAIVKRADAVDSVNAVRHREPDQPSLNEKDKALHEHLVRTISDEDVHIRDLRRDLYQSYAFTRLHFKPNDLSFTRIEQKFDVIVEMLDKLEALRTEENLSERLVSREKIYAAVADITGYSRDILKTTWETVKRGERAYELTKKWSIIGGGATLLVLLVFALFAVVSLSKRADTTVSSSQVSGKTAQVTPALESGAISPQAHPSVQVPLANQVVQVITAPACKQDPRSAPQQRQTPASQACGK